MNENMSLLTDSQVEESITNISLWLQTQCRIAPYDKQHEVCAEDLAIAVPGECLFPSLTHTNEEASREEEKGILVYTDSRDEKYLWLYGFWHPLEKVLSIPAPKNGWVRTTTLGERFLLLILTQLDYRADGPFEVPYGCCPLQDPGYLLWQNNRGVGMCSLKRKGTSIWGGEETYACTTLDTLYVRYFARRHGHALELLRLLASQLPPGEHIAVSHPVSLKMCKVLYKFVHAHPELSESLWTLDEDGEVSGTVILMLGSLIRQRFLVPVPPNQQPIRIQSGTLIKTEQRVLLRSQSSSNGCNAFENFEEGGRMITDSKDSKMCGNDDGFGNGNIGGDGLGNEDKSQQQPMSVQSPEPSPNVDEPCDTS